MIYRSTEIEGIDAAHPCACEDCDWTGPFGALGPAQGAILTPGDPSPAGRCPDCGALAYIAAPLYGRTWVSVAVSAMPPTQPADVILEALRVAGGYLATAEEDQATGIAAGLYDADEGAVISAEHDAHTELFALAARAAADLETKPGARAIIRRLIGAADGLETQVEQMRGLFDDEDGAIQEALDDAAAETTAARAFLDSTTAPRVVVTVEGGCVQNIAAEGAEGLTAVLIDFDFDCEGGGEGCCLIPQAGLDPAPATVELFEVDSLFPSLIAALDNPVEYVAPEDEE